MNVRRVGVKVSGFSREEPQAKTADKLFPNRSKQVRSKLFLHANPFFSWVNFCLVNQRKRSCRPTRQRQTIILRWGIDHPGIKSTNPQLKLETYTLTIDGEVENPVKLSWNDFMKLPKTFSTSDFHCVEGWSVVDCKWEGVHIREIEKLVKPKDVAKAVTFECADSYTTSLFRGELIGRRCAFSVQAQRRGA